MLPPSPICLICSAPRHNKRDGPYCLEHVRERHRNNQRRLYGTDPNLPPPAPRKFPRGCCSVCGATPYKDGKCNICLKIYKQIKQKERQSNKEKMCRKN